MKRSLFHYNGAEGILAMKKSVASRTQDTPWQLQGTGQGGGVAREVCRAFCIRSMCRAGVLTLSAIGRPQRGIDSFFRGGGGFYFIFLTFHFKMFSELQKCCRNTKRCSIIYTVCPFPSNVNIFKFS